MFVTGSNSKLLHGKLADRLTGRAKKFEIYHFMYSEVLEYKKANNIDINEDSFYDFLNYGGMPQRFEETDENGIYSYLNELYASIIEKDVYGNHKKSTKHILKIFLSILFLQLEKYSLHYLFLNI